MTTEVDIFNVNGRDLKGKERADWLKSLQDALLERIDNFEPSEEDTAELFNFMAQFWNYSFNNQLLIQKQWKGAYVVGSFKHWNDLGYEIKTGEKAQIFVWVPMTYKRIELPNGKLISYSKADSDTKRRADSGELKVYKKRTFKPGSVFEISQTTVPLEEYPKILPNRHINFEDDEVNYEDVLEGIDRLASKIGTELFYDTKNVLGNSKGAYFHRSGKILMNKYNTPSEMVSVAIHELGHAKMHKETELPRSLKELQAELVSSIVSMNYGLNTSENAIMYIHQWTKEGLGRVSLEEADNRYELKNILREVQRVAKHFITVINGE